MHGRPVAFRGRMPGYGFAAGQDESDIRERPDGQEIYERQAAQGRRARPRAQDLVMALAVEGLVTGAYELRSCSK